jgi:transcriptional regulator with XRE-family HTH domain
MKVQEREERTARQVGNALRRIRKQKERKQYIVAESAGITRRMLCLYENGWQCPSVPTLAKVLAALDCTVEDFGRMVGPWGCLPASR